MAECYCGCGRKIGTFATGRKSANKMGRLIGETLADIESDVRPRLGVTAPNAMSEKVDKTVEWGGWFEADCRHVVHEESKFGDKPWPAMREWVRDAQGMVSFFRLPPEAQRAIAES